VELERECQRPPAVVVVDLLPTIDEKLAQSLSAQLESQNTPQKPKNNPWRKIKVGKALYKPSTPPKN